MKLKRPSRPEPRSPQTYVDQKERILTRVRAAINSRGWECKDLHKFYPSIRAKKYRWLMDECEDWRFSMQFACSVAEAVGVDPWDEKAPLILPQPEPIIQYVRVMPLPRPRLPNPCQLALDLAA